jgi:hypothetical protein
MTEREHQRVAFEKYFEMGSTRSLTKLAKQLGVSVSTTKTWSRELRWRDRLEERGREVAKVMANRSIKSVADSKARNEQLLQLALVQVARALAEGRVRVTISDLDKLLRLEEFLAGRADSRHELMSRELEGKSTDELKAMLRKEVEDLQSLVEPSDN